MTMNVWEILAKMQIVWTLSAPIDVFADVDTDKRDELHVLVIPFNWYIILYCISSKLFNLVRVILLLNLTTAANKYQTTIFFKLY